MTQSRISAISYCLPEKVLTNDELAALYPGWTADKIFEKTGIRERHLSADDETAGDLGENAARGLFAEHAIDPSTIDFILLATQSPDYFLPTTACIMQTRLGIPTTAGALDFNLGCSAYIYGLSLAKGLIAGNLAKRVLLITAETYTKYIHPLDKSTRTIFGDAAAATIIDTAPKEQIGNFVFGTDGSGYKSLIVPAGGMRLPKSQETAVEQTDDSANVRSQDNLFMDGPEILNFTLDVVPGMVEQALIRNNLHENDIDLFVFHQANLFILNMLRKSLKLPKEKFYVNLEDTGNTVSSTIPIALNRAEADGRLKRGIRDGCRVWRGALLGRDRDPVVIQSKHSR
jgi:3-oxoacyl-[acyl-carrier-protein] synthase-3